MKQTSRTSLLFSVLGFGVATILFLIPFHATLTVWVASNIGHYTAVRLWKEYLLVVLGLTTIVLAASDRKIRRALFQSWIFWLIVAYILITVLVGVVSLHNHDVSAKAFGYALIINLRFFAFFLVCLVIAAHSKLLQRNWSKILLIPAAIVVLFGLLQHYILPTDFLRHLGYGPSTINPYETVDQNSNYVRVQSTLRGPNPLGAYLVVVVSAVAVMFMKVRDKLKRWLLVAMGLGTMVVLFYSYSRSALIGAILSLVLIVWLSLRSSYARRMLGIISVLFVLVAGVGYLSLRHNLRFEDIFLHTSTQTHSAISSNANHESAVKSGLKDIIHQPLGRGPGTAGPASVYNNHPARISEDYYIQLGQEVGVLGLAIFLAINVLVAKALWDNRRDRLSLILLCSLVGLSLVNLLSHAWADDTLAYLWWGLAGIATYPVIIGSKENKDNGKKITQEKTTV